VDSYTYDGRGTLDIDGRAADVTIRGAGEAGLLLIEQVVLEPKGASGVGAVAATGRVELDLRQANLALTARDFDPGWIRADWPGRLTGTVGLRAELGPAAQVRFDALDMSGELRRYPVALRGAATFVAPDHWRLESLQLDSETNLVLLDGTLERAGLDLAVTADVEQLGLLWPGAVGALTAEISVDGSWQEPHARGTMDARSLRLENVTFDRLTVDGEIGLAPAAPLALLVEAHGVARGLVSADSVRATFAGTTGAQRIDVEAQAGEWLAKVAASGGLTAGVWRGSIDSLDVDEQLLGQWRLTDPAAASLGMSGGSLATSCLLHDSGARWCAELNVTGVPEDRLVVSAQNFALATLRPLLPPQFVVDGVYQLSASLFDLTGEPRGALALTGGATRARVVFGAEQAFVTEFDEVLASATLLESRLELQANVRSGAAGRVDLNARIDDIGARDSSIDGAVNVQWPDLAFLALLSPELSQVGGTLDVGLTIAGTIANPEVDGRAAWQGGRVAVPAWGLVVEGIEATATSDDGRSLTFDATGHAGDGELRLTGTTALDPQAGWPTRLNLRGESVQAVQLPNAQVYVTPNLDIVVALPDLRVTGTVHVPRAALELSELPAQAVVPSPDVVLHGVAVGDEVRPLRLQADIELTLGEDVRYAGLNLETLVSGRMRLNRDSNRSATATGTLTLAGTYNAYGQTLQLERGELLFSGPLDDPGLDVRAVRVIDETRVGIELAGTVKAPRTRVFSTPAMSEADALSYLLLGRPVTSSDGEETATLQTAAISMGLQQALPVVQRIGESLGFDEFTVQTTDTDAGALMAGKYLSPKIYIRYSYGLFNRIGGLLLRFKVNDRLSIETRSGDQKSMDLLYTVEKD
jgi:translocation and assembly module TamB